MLNIYIDGSARNNGKNNAQGGFGIVIFDNNNNLIDAYCEQQKGVTNNQMELMAFVRTFEILQEKYSKEQITIYSDSSYCINILTSWMDSWSLNNWTIKNGRKVKNLDIILLLYKYYKTDFFKSQVNLVKIKGHNGILGNELADALATADKSKFSRLILQNRVKLL